MSRDERVERLAIQEEQVVFAGYIQTTLGMIIVLNNRLRERRLMAKHATAGGAA
ncbi:MAG: hypothetical protein H6817_04075 [Phycisphaerales bacterium]|nr:hypothetical protein [Phycisphaerales bacterium]